MSQSKNIKQTLKSKSHKNTSFTKIAIEVVSIVFGVLLALAVNVWRTQRVNQAEAESALTHLQ